MSLSSILAGSEWELVDNTEVTMKHDGASHMHLHGGNSFNGQATLSSNTLTVSPGFMSTMMMPHGSGQVAQQRVQKFIADASSQGPLTVSTSPDGKTLTMVSASGTPVAVFQQKFTLPPPDAPKKFVEIAKEPLEVRPDGEKILNCKWIHLDEHSCEIPSPNEAWFPFSERKITNYEHRCHAKCRVIEVEGGAKWFNEMQYYSSVE